MIQLTSTLPTARPAALMATAAKHFAHKVAVEVDDTAARIAFPTGLGLMRVTDTGLAHFQSAYPGESISKGCCSSR